MLYYILNLLLAPGIILHELSHALFCWLSGIQVFKIRLFSFGNPPGYVEHAEPETFIQNLLISFGPLIFNSFGALVLFGGVQEPWLKYQNVLFVWLGIVFGLEAIPSEGDAKALWQVSKRQMKHNPLVIFGLPFVVLLYALNFLRRWKLGFVYMVFLAVMGMILLKK
jgi:hypothetical protein